MFTVTGKRGGTNHNPVIVTGSRDYGCGYECDIGSGLARIKVDCWALMEVCSLLSVIIVPVLYVTVQTFEGVHRRRL